MVMNVVTNNHTREALSAIRLATCDGIGMCDLVEVGSGTERRRTVWRFTRCDNDARRSNALRVKNGSNFVITI